MKKILLLLFLSTRYLLAEQFVVSVPVTDVMVLELEGKCQKALLNGRVGHLCSHDSGGRQSQLLAGDIVDVVRDCGDDWVVADVREQERISMAEGMRWEPVRGLVWQKDLRKVDIGLLEQPTHVLYENCVLKKTGTKDVTLLAGTRVVAKQCLKEAFSAKITCAQSAIIGCVPWTALRPLNQDGAGLANFMRSNIVNFARSFLGAPYRWGGCSGYDAAEKNTVTGVDCSGLVYLAYRSVGIDVPRNSPSQFLKSTPVLEGKDLQPGDCVFFARLIPETTTSKVYHVLMVKDKNTLIEATGSGAGLPRIRASDMSEEEASLAGCREINPEKHYILQRPLSKVCHGQMINGRLVYLGRFLPQAHEEQGVFCYTLPTEAKKMAAGNVRVHKQSGLVDIPKALPEVIVDPLYAKERNFTSQILYQGVDTCFAHKDLIPFLKRASDKLRDHGYALMVFDGYRPHRFQYVMFDLVPADGAAAGATNGFIADPKKGSNHNRGVAVDVTLVHLQGPKKGQEVVMPSAYDEFSVRSWVNYEACRDEAAVKARDLLVSVMTSVELKVNPKEWWHFALPEPTRYPLLDIPFDEFLIN